MDGKEKQLSLGLDAPSTLRDKMKSKVGRRVVNLTTSQLKAQGRRVRTEKADAPAHTQLAVTILDGNEFSTATVDHKDTPKPKAERYIAPKKESESERVSKENERMTHRQKMESQYGKDKTVRTGSSVRVLNRIALYEVGHGLNGGGTREEVKDAAEWQGQFKVNSRGSSGSSTSYNNGDFSQDKESK